MKNLLLVVCLCFLGYGVSAAQTTCKITKVNNRLYSDWNINGVQATVMLETAFPRIVIDQSFAENNKHLLGFDLKPAPENMSIAFWGVDEKHRVKYIVNDPINVNGIMINSEALVVDLAAMGKADRDIIFPIDLLGCGVEIDIKRKKMRLFDTETYSREGSAAYDMVFDSTRRKRLYYIENELECLSGKDTARIGGLFLLDLGNANAFVFNKSNPEIPPFLKKALKTQRERLEISNAGKMTNVSVVNPEYLYFDGFLLRNVYLTAMSLYMNEQERFICILGNRFFERFTIAFDFPGRKFYMKPN